MKTKRLYQWAKAAALVMCLPLCMTSCKDDSIDNPVKPAEQSTEEPTEDAVDVTTDKSYVLYGVPSEGIGEAVCRRLKGSETAPFMAEVYVIDPSKNDELGIGIENWKEMVRRTWDGDAAVVVTQCSYRNFYRFTVNYVLAALALKAEMNGEELDLGNYDSKHVSIEREVLANAVRNAYQMYRANHSAPGEVTERDWAHIDQWPDEEQNAIMLDAYGFCQGNELYVMNAAVNKPDTIEGIIIPPAQPETAYQWGQKADAVTDWINRQGKEDSESRAGMENFRRAITRAEETPTKISDLMNAQQHETVLDYKYPRRDSYGERTAYGAIKINHQVYSAYQFDASNSGSNIEYYQVCQQITVLNNEIYRNGWYVRTNDGGFNLASGAWMTQIYTNMGLEGKGTKYTMFASPINKIGSTSGSTTIGGSDGFSEGISIGANYGARAGLTVGGNYNISYSHSWTWSNSTSWNVSDMETECNEGNDENRTVLWIHKGYEPGSMNDIGEMKDKKNLTSTCTTSENVIWKVQNPQGTYKLKSYFCVKAATVKLHDWKWDSHVIENSQSSIDISFVLNTPNRYKYTWSNDIYNYGSVQGNINDSKALREYINNKYGSGSEDKENICWGETFSTSEATKNGSDNARLLFQTFKNRIRANKQSMKASGFGGQIEFVLKPADDTDIIESFILDLENKYNKGDIFTETVNGYDLTFKVTKTDLEVELISVPSDFKGELVIPEYINNGLLTVTGLGYGCAANNTGIISIVIPKTVTSISDYAFYKLNNLIEVHLKATTPPAMGGWNAFDGRKVVLYVPEGCEDAYACTPVWDDFGNIVKEGTKNPQNLRIKQQVEGYGLTFKVTKENEEVELESVPNNFQGVLNIPANVGHLKVTSLGWCCHDITGITEVHVPEGVKSIECEAFRACKNLTKAYLPSTLTYLGWSNYTECPSLREVHIKATTPPYTDNKLIFDIETNHRVLYVPYGCKEAYTHDEVWNDVENIVEE
ncbi:MAG: leucine-rich repeat protein [Bacteroidaceae bacterium]|nr:leucine-rich repeat protein [Bacteroidaceae bacterium]